MKIVRLDKEALNKLDNNLILFLKWKGILDIFIDNFVNLSSFKVYKNKSVKTPSQGFIWKQSKQGSDYWSEIDDDFNNWIKKDENSKKQGISHI